MIEISGKYKIGFKDTLTYLKVNPDVLKKFQKPKSIIENILTFEGARIFRCKVKTIIETYKYH